MKFFEFFIVVLSFVIVSAQRDTHVHHYAESKADMKNKVGNGGSHNGGSHNDDSSGGLIKITGGSFYGNNIGGSRHKLVYSGKPRLENYDSSKSSLSTDSMETLDIQSTSESPYYRPEIQASKKSPFA